jgi:hypothetical protein
MSRIIILLPFQKKTQSDLWLSATELRTFFYEEGTSTKIGENIGADVEGIDIIYLTDNYDCNHGDYVIVFAHGADSNTNLYDNKGGVTSSLAVRKKLDIIQAQRVEKVLFMCCYSALDNHIARVWKKANQGQTVYGGNSAISNLYSATRTQIRTICFALREV